MSICLPSPPTPPSSLLLEMKQYKDQFYLIREWAEPRAPFGFVGSYSFRGHLFAI
jgi:hypothetical protein